MAYINNSNSKNWDINARFIVILIQYGEVTLKQTKRHHSLLLTFHVLFCVLFLSRTRLSWNTNATCAGRCSHAVTTWSCTGCDTAGYTRTAVTCVTGASPRRHTSAVTWRSTPDSHSLSVPSAGRVSNISTSVRSMPTDTTTTPWRRRRWYDCRTPIVQ